MSQGQPVPLAEAQVIAGAFLRLLAGSCDRAEIAGSIRRRKPQVHDIEIVAIPTIRREAVQSLFSELADMDETNVLEAVVATLLVGGDVQARKVENHRADGTVDVQTKLGPAFKALVFRGLALDLFITTPDLWGCIFALRTGPGDWNTRLVTDCKRIFRRVEGGRVLHLGKPVPTPEEDDFFRALGQPWVEPWDRAPERVRIDFAIANGTAS